MEIVEGLILDNIIINETTKSSFSVHMEVGVFVADWHDHNKNQLLYAEGGALSLETKNHCFFLPARHAAWIPANCMHRVTSKSPDLFLRMLYFEKVDFEAASLLNLDVFPINNLAREMIYQTRVWNYSFNESSQLEKLFYQTLRLFIAEWASVPIPLSLPTTSHPKLLQVTEYIRGNLDVNLQMEVVAARFAVSKRTLMRLFKQELSVTYMTFIRITRIVGALELLSRPGANVSTVAFSVGYESLSAFSTTFYQLVGIRPREYIKKAMIAKE